MIVFRKHIKIQYGKSMNIKISFTILIYTLTALLLSQKQFAHDGVGNKDQKIRFVNEISFGDDFENGAGQWEFYLKRDMKPLPDDGKIIDSKDPSHGKVLSIPPGGMIALIKNSNDWSNYKVEGEVCFPKNEASLMGLVYNLNLVPRRNHKEPKKNL